MNSDSFIDSFNEDMGVHEARLFRTLIDRHEALYQQVLRDYRIYQKNLSARESFEKDIRYFLDDLYEFSRVATSDQCLKYISLLFGTWHVALSTLVPVSLDFALPRFSRPHLTGTFLYERDLDKRLEMYAYRLHYGMDIHGDQPEKITNTDRHHAEVYFASEVLSAEISFPHELSPDSYPRLEHIWLEEVKTIRAYHIWEERGRIWDPLQEKSDYFLESERLIQLLGNPSIKVPPNVFAPIADYIEYYARIRLLDEPEYQVRNLVARKAQRVASTVCWLRDEEIFGHVVNYVKDFYGNIIPAIIDKEEKAIEAVLRAFVRSQTHGSQRPIINCFEAAIAIFFLDATAVQHLWRFRISSTRQGSVRNRFVSRL
jgi:hypothetical protein